MKRDREGEKRESSPSPGGGGEGGGGGGKGAEGKSQGLANRRPGWELPKRAEGLVLSPDDCLVENEGSRRKCTTCGKSRLFYCGECQVALVGPMPHVRLPFQVSVVTSPGDESLLKSTGVHARLLAPDDVAMHDVDHCPPFDPARSLVLFPSKEALEVGEVAGRDIDRIFVIDSKWKKGNGLAHHAALAGCQHVKLKDTRTAFWRFHTAGVSPDAVCTVEAIYHLCKSMHEARNPGGGPCHAYDDLLWLFDYNHRQVESHVRRRSLGLPREPRGGGGGGGANRPYNA